MAKLSLIEGRKAKAMEDHAAGLKEVNEKLDQVLAMLAAMSSPVVTELVATQEPEPAPEAPEGEVDAPKTRKGKK